MIGRRVESAKGHTAPAAYEVRLKVTDLSVRSDQPHGTDIRDVSFSVHAGEILGIAGIAGNGQTELMNALSGETGPPQAGAIEILASDASQDGSHGPAPVSVPSLYQKSVSGRRQFRISVWCRTVS